jgi:hypothetical protein
MLREAGAVQRPPGFLNKCIVKLRSMPGLPVIFFALGITARNKSVYCPKQIQDHSTMIGQRDKIVVMLY